MHQSVLIFLLKLKLFHQYLMHLIFFFWFDHAYFFSDFSILSLAPFTLTSLWQSYRSLNSSFFFNLTWSKIIFCRLYFIFFLALLFNLFRFILLPSLFSISLLFNVIFLNSLVYCSVAKALRALTFVLNIVMLNSEFNFLISFCWNSWSVTILTFSYFFSFWKILL